MESTVWSAESRAALAAVAASVAELAAISGAGADHADQSGTDRSGAVSSLEAESDPWADPLRDRADACLDGLAVAAREEARFAALKVRLTADYAEATRAMASPTASLHDRAVQEMAMIAELACVLTVSEHAADTLLGQSQALTTQLPLTLEALQDGTISWDHARIMVDETTDLGRAGAAALEAHFLDPAAPNPARGCPAGELVPGRFRAKSRTWRERHHPDSIETRHTKSAKDRRVEFAPDRDGMAWLSAYLPAGTAAGIWDRMTAAARALQGPGEPRTLTQLRADVAATLLLGPGTTGADGNAGSGDVPVPRAQVLITVPVLSLLGATEEPAMLDGYGPIPPSMARALIADGAESFHRVLTDPRDGAPLEIGRANYRPTKAMRQWLRLRDGRCPFPGCNNPSLDNEADHLLAWADGGTTGITNLGQPCRKHHGLKHGSGWTPSGATKNKTPGWTSPSGRYYPSEQQDWEPPDWPPHLLVRDTLPAAGEGLDVGPPPYDGPGQDPELELPADPGWDPELELPADPGQDPELELPPDPGQNPDWDLESELPPDPRLDPDTDLTEDPVPDWHVFMEGHAFPSADTERPPWPPHLEHTVKAVSLAEALVAAFLAAHDDVRA